MEPCNSRTLYQWGGLHGLRQTTGLLLISMRHNYSHSAGGLKQERLAVSLHSIVHLGGAGVRAHSLKMVCQTWTVHNKHVLAEKVGIPKGYTAETLSKPMIKVYKKNMMDLRGLRDILS